MPESQRRDGLDLARRGRRRGPLLLTLACLGLLAGGCGSAETSSSAPSSPPSGPAIEIAGSTLSHYDDTGRLVWTMDAAVVQHERGADRSRAQDVRVRFMDTHSNRETQTASLAIRADRLVFDRRTRHLFLQGGVRGEGPEGLTFKTDRAQWDAERGVVTGDSAVRIRRDDLSMRGTGFTYALQSASLSLQSASLRIQLDGSP